MKKAIKVIAAAACMSAAMGLAAFAANSGWATENNQWVYYQNGTKVYNEWKTDAKGLYYYLGGNGNMVTSSFIDNERYVDTDGHMLTSTWRQIDGKWYYFDTNGRIISDKSKQINGVYYYFDVDGVMMTGWVESGDGNWYYCEPSDGHMVSSTWKYLAPAEGMNADDHASMSVADTGEYWYYFQSSGKMAMADKSDYKEFNISGKRYAFDDIGRMATGWVKLNSTSPAIAGYKFYNDSDAIGDFGAAHVGWLSQEPPQADGFGSDVVWYYFGTNGVPYYGTDVSTSDDDETLVAKFKRLARNGKTETYLFDTYGNPVYGLRKVKRSSGAITSMYFGTKTECCLQLGEKNITEADGSQSVFCFDSAGYGYNGVHGGKLYYMGKLQKAIDDSHAFYTVGGTTYLVNRNGALVKNYNKGKASDDVDYKSDANGRKAGGIEDDSELMEPEFTRTEL